MKYLVFYSAIISSLFFTVNTTIAQHCGYQYVKNQEIERYTEGYVQNFETTARPRTVVKIPVVVHVVWNTAAENISDAQIRGQIDSLTKDFRKKNTDVATIPSQRFRDLAADCEIEFCLATRDTLGNSSTGIVRRQTTVTNIGDGTINQGLVYYTSRGGDNAWRPDRYLNIWVCAFPDEILGYSTPIAKVLATSPAEDGCVVNYKAFGVNPNNYVGRNKGRTLVHEVGHYFNLLHIFGSDRTCNDDDEVEDTPKQAGQNNYCPDFPALQSCAANGGDMFMNYMDYPYDGCVLMFTKGQKARMWATLSGYRKDLILGGAVCDPFVGIDAVVEADWSVSPNPAVSNLTISMRDAWKKKSIKVQLTDVLGRVLLEKRFYTEGSLFSLDGVSNGLYFVIVQVDSQVFMKKIVVVK